MSIINNALRKAQKEKENLYRHYERIIFATSDQQTDKRKKIIVATSIVATLLVLITFMFIMHIAFSDKSSKEEVVHKTVMKKSMPPLSQTTANESTKPRKIVRSKSVPLPPQATEQEPKTPPEIVSSKSVPPSPPAMAKDLETPPIPQDPATLYQEALAYQRNDSLTRAEELYKKILEIDPKHVNAFNNLGVIYMGQKRNEEAISAFEKAIALKGDYVDPHYNLACLYSQSDNIPKSLDYLKKAIKIEKNVKNWAKDDKDLNKLRRSAEYGSIVGAKAKTSKEKFDVYIVKEGDWIFSIIRTKFGTSEEEIYKILKTIKRINPALRDTNIVHPGQKLLLPKREG